MQEKIKLDAQGGCSAKIGPGVLKCILEKIPKFSNPNLLVGFETSDDAAVFRLNDEIAVVQTLDFFSPIVEDPYSFGAIAAANALSDIYAMGGNVQMALNIACFDEQKHTAIMKEILRGGGDKILEAGGVICGGHSVNDKNIKYGLSVMGTVHPKRILRNNTCNVGDKLIVTKPLGVGLIMSAKKVGEASENAFLAAEKSMQTLNKFASETMLKFKTNACTDITGFGFLGHLNEMITKDYSAKIICENVPYIKEAKLYAQEFFMTAAAQKNRNHVSKDICFGNADFETQELFFDPQTSGGLLICVDSNDAQELLFALNKAEIKSSIVGEIVSREEKNIMLV